MKVVALDIGTQWTGIALSDALKIIAKPYDTVATAQLEPFLQTLFKQEKIEKCIVGYPQTMRGTISEQTRYTLEQYEALKKTYPQVEWMLWDERLSSKRAAHLKSAKTAQEKKHQHAIAAAFILESYLTFQAST